MGLDMYLTKEIKHQYGIDEEEIIYWRKVNAIHKWFVDNCQNGNDDCNKYKVTKEQLKELKELCEKVSKKQNQEIAKMLLPTQEGFFFGSTDYDEYYYDEIKNTKEALEKELINAENTNNEVEYFYQSSW